MRLETYFSIGNALIELMDPLLEVVIHDLRTNKIIFIAGSLSKRAIGDSSLLDDDTNAIEQVQEVYAKINFDGRLLRSISIPIKENNVTVALMCINCDVTVFQELETLATLFLGKASSKKPEVLFKNDWQERIHQCIHSFIKEKNLKFNTLTNKEKKEIIQFLYDQGAFSEKNAADYIAKIMNMSRATIFNHLRTFRKDAHAI